MAVKPRHAVEMRHKSPVSTLLIAVQQREEPQKLGRFCCIHVVATPMFTVIVPGRSENTLLELFWEAETLTQESELKLGCYIWYAGRFLEFKQANTCLFVPTQLV